MVNCDIGNAVGDNGIIIRTTNGGIDWETQVSGTTNQLTDVSFNNENNGIAVGIYGTILKTTNGGANWNLQLSGLTNWLYGISLYDNDNGIAVGWGGLIAKNKRWRNFLGSSNKWNNR